MVEQAGDIPAHVECKLVGQDVSIHLESPLGDPSIVPHELLEKHPLYPLIVEQGQNNQMVADLYERSGGTIVLNALSGLRWGGLPKDPRALTYPVSVGVLGNFAQNIRNLAAGLVTYTDRDLLGGKVAFREQVNDIWKRQFGYQYDNVSHAVDILRSLGSEFARESVASVRLAGLPENILSKFLGDAPSIEELGSLGIKAKEYFDQQLERNGIYDALRSAIMTTTNARRETHQERAMEVSSLLTNTVGRLLGQPRLEDALNEYPDLAEATKTPLKLPTASDLVWSEDNGWGGEKMAS